MGPLRHARQRRGMVPRSLHVKFLRNIAKNKTSLDAVQSAERKTLSATSPAAVAGSTRPEKCRQLHVSSAIPTRFGSSSTRNGPKDLVDDQRRLRRLSRRGAVQERCAGRRGIRIEGELVRATRARSLAGLAGGAVRRPANSQAVFHGLRPLERRQWRTFGTTLLSRRNLS